MVSNWEREREVLPHMQTTFMCCAQLISEDPEMEERPTFDATEWAYEQVPRQSGSVEGFGDLGTIFYATVQLPAGFGRPGDSPLGHLAPADSPLTSAVHLLTHPPVPDLMACSKTLSGHNPALGALLDCGHPVVRSCIDLYI